MNFIKYFLIGLKSTMSFSLLFIKNFFIGIITIITIIPYYLIKGIKFIFSKKEKNKEIEKKFIPITIVTLSVLTYLISIFILTRWYVQSKRTQYFSESLINNSIIIQENITEETPDQYKDLTENIQTNENNINTPPINNTQNNNTNSNSNSNTTQNIISNNNTNNNQNNNSNNPSSIINNQNFINVNLNSYKQKNSETVGWIQVNGTKVNYPIVKHNDNDFYLKHDFYKRKTTNGWIFADYRNNFEKFDNNTIIYGHNLINDTMFGSIPNILKNNWFSNKNNHYIKLSTDTTNSIWKIFSIYKISPVTDYLQTKFNSTITYQTFLNKLKERSKFDFNTEINYTDKIITLSTCDDTGTKRVVIHAKLINIENK